jgi:hypothetical protein
MAAVRPKHVVYRWCYYLVKYIFFIVVFYFILLLYTTEMTQIKKKKLKYHFYILLYQHLTIQQINFIPTSTNTLQCLGFQQSWVNFEQCAKIIPESGKNLTVSSIDQTDQTTYATSEMRQSALCGTYVPMFQNNQLPPYSVMMIGYSQLL